MRDVMCVKDMERKHGVRWCELVALEPGLGHLLTFARTAGSLCRNWTDVDRRWNRFKDDLATLVGCFGRNRTHPVLGTVGAYEVVYWRLHNAVARDSRSDD